MVSRLPEIRRRGGAPVRGGDAAHIDALAKRRRVRQRLCDELVPWTGPAGPRMAVGVSSPLRRVPLAPACRKEGTPS